MQNQAACCTSNPLSLPLGVHSIVLSLGEKSGIQLMYCVSILQISPQRLSDLILLKNALKPLPQPQIMHLIKLDVFTFPELGRNKSYASSAGFLVRHMKQEHWKSHQKKCFLEKQLTTLLF